MRTGTNFLSLSVCACVWDNGPTLSGFILFIARLAHPTSVARCPRTEIHNIRSTYVGVRLSRLARWLHILIVHVEWMDGWMELFLVLLNVLVLYRTVPSAGETVVRQCAATEEQPMLEPRHGGHGSNLSCNE